MVQRLGRTEADQRIDAGAGMVGLPLGKRIGPCPFHDSQYFYTEQPSHAAHFGSCLPSLWYHTGTVLY